MKKLSLYISLVVLILGSFYACDKIEEPFFKPVYTEVTVAGELFADAATLDELTYSNFINLTSGSDEVSSILILSGDTSLEGNSLAANQLVSKLGISVQTPIVAFNRKDLTGIPQSNWQSALEQAIAEETEFILEIDYETDSLNHTVNGICNIKSLNNYSQAISASVYIIEDSVRLSSFAVDRLLREASFNLFELPMMVREVEHDFSFNIDISEIKKIEKMSVVVILENKATGVILQTGENKKQTTEIEFSTKQKFLIEDFTGHQCGSCPNAHIELASLHNLYGDQIVPLAIHYGYFAEISTQYPTNFITPIATHIGDYFAIPYTPVGMVNRMGATDNKLVDHGNWGTVIANHKDSAPLLGMAIKDAKVENNKIVAAVYVKAYETIDTLLKIQYFIAESHIIAPQLFYNHDPERIADYEHNHVLRASANGLWGEDLTSVPYYKNKVVGYNLSFNLSSEWNADNLHLIVIVYNDVTKEILQVESADL